MVTFQSIETQEEIEFNHGYDAYYAGRESFHTESPDFREGYKQAWHEDNRLPDWKDPEGNAIDQMWEAHVDAM